LALCIGIFVAGIIHGNDLWGMLKMSVILSVAAIPEGLPVAITLILALGMKRILKKKGLVKKMVSIETLGAVSVICTDKTGTLTEGLMRAVKSDFSDKEMASLALFSANDQKNNLEISLWEYAKKTGNINTHEIFKSSKRVYEEQFSSERKFMMTINIINGKEIAFLVGAPEIILSYCRNVDKEKTLEKIEEWAGEGLKIIGVANKEKGDLKEKEDFSWLGLIGVEDPVREGVKEAISFAKKAGMEVKIVTGDFRKTAEKIASNLGFDIKPENVMEGSELETILEGDLRKRINKILIFCRVTPHQKMKIVRVLQEKGEIVSMTGDGVNDALALKKADIGVVMGDSSDVAKEVGDLILLDNNFKTIISACEEGRLIFSNIKKVVAYLLSNSVAQMILIFGAMTFDLASPLTVAQILWINLICDGPLDIVLGFEPSSKELMREKPRKMMKESILAGPIKFLVTSISIAIGLISLIIFKSFYDWTGNLELGRTIVFAIILMTSLFYVFSFKNLEKPIFKMENFFKNKYLFLAVFYGIALLFCAIYVPKFNHILGTVPLGLIHWIIILGVAILITFFTEITKMVWKKIEANKNFALQEEKLS